MSAKSSITVGARVGYSARFLRSIGGGLETGEENRQGTVLELRAAGSMRVARVHWDDTEETSSALVVNLAPLKSWRNLDPDAPKAY